MAAYLDTRKMPEIPDDFGHEPMIDDWRVLANDLRGCCVWSGAAHEHMLLGTVAGKGMVFNDDGVLGDYAAVTGFNPDIPASDQGTVVRDAMNYRRQTGIIDAFGNRHKIAAYVSIEPRNLAHIYAAMYLFGCVGIGVLFPDSAMDQFHDEEPWSVVPGPMPSSGHYVSLVAKRRHPVCVTWGKLQEISETFLLTYCDEAWAFLTDDWIRDGKSPEGFALEDLKSDLALVTA